MNYRKLLAVMALGFLLGIQDGHIALWKDGNPEPVEIFPFRADMLPEKDEKALKKGIRIEDPTQLARLMEDYLS